MGDPADDNVAVGPMIDQRQLDAAHAIVTDSVAAGARLPAGGTYEGLMYRPTVLADVPLTARAYAEEIFGPVAPVVGSTIWTRQVKLATAPSTGCRWASSRATSSQRPSRSRSVPPGLCTSTTRP